MRAQNRNDQGMTLLEIIVVITVISILSGTLLHAITYWQAVGVKTHKVMLRQQELQSALDRIIDGTSTVDGLVGATSADLCGGAAPCDRLTYDLVDGVTVKYYPVHGQVNCDSQPDTTVDATLTRLCQKVNTDQAVEVAPNIDSFTTEPVNNATNQLVSIKITIISGVPGVGGTRTIKLETMVHPRNFITS